jgi:hypothetical protein
MAAFDGASSKYDCVLFDGGWLGKQGTLHVYQDKAVFAKKLSWPIWLFCALALAALLYVAMHIPANIDDTLSFLLMVALAYFFAVVICIPLVSLVGAPLGMFLGFIWRGLYKGKAILEFRAEDVSGLEQVRCRGYRFAYKLTLKDGRSPRLAIGNAKNGFTRFGDDIRTMQRQAGNQVSM